ncbi:MAG: flagellar biosynthetic protein FliO [Verrucomicrobia bacterium]|nr:flagellar biosynthetic protein FliO [Verrucomicrobiota bacterium]
MISYLLDKLVFTAGENGELISQNLAETAAEMPPPTDYASAIIHMLLTIVAIIVLLFASIWYIRRLIQNRLQKGVGEQAIQILEKRMISPKTMLYLVEVEGKKTLIAESHLEVRKIDSLN